MKRMNTKKRKGKRNYNLSPQKAIENMDKKNITENKEDKSINISSLKKEMTTMVSEMNNIYLKFNQFLQSNIEIFSGKSSEKILNEGIISQRKKRFCQYQIGAKIFLKLMKKTINYKR